jgi:two-component system response regulator
VLRRIKSDPETAVCPVVVLTSSRELNDHAASYKLGANSYIVKPVDFDQFNKSVAEIGTYWLTLNDEPPRS